MKYFCFFYSMLHSFLFSVCTGRRNKAGAMKYFCFFYSMIHSFLFSVCTGRRNKAGAMKYFCFFCSMGTNSVVPLKTHFTDTIIIFWRRFYKIRKNNYSIKAQTVSHFRTDPIVSEVEVVNLKSLYFLCLRNVPAYTVTIRF